MMELPPQPKDSDFYSLEGYQAAIASWERVCMAIIKAQPAALPSSPAEKGQ